MSLRLVPDLTQFTFSGEESVAITVNQPTAEIVLNALELEIDRASAERGGVSVAGKAEPDPGKSAPRSASIARWSRASGRSSSRFAES